MTDGYSWRDQRSGGTYRLPGSEHLGWWAAVAMLLSILMHVVVFFALDRIKIALHFDEERELSTGPVQTTRVEIPPAEPDQSLPPENVVQPPPDSAALMEEVELLAVLPKDVELDIKPDVKEAEYALQMTKPAMEGDPKAVALEASAGLDIEADLPEFGRDPETIRPAEMGQMTVDPGAAQPDDLDLGKFTEDLVKRGANGSVEKGALDGITSLDHLLDLPPNVLLSKKTMLPSDLLFEFNSSDLRESAKVGLMKLALLMDRNPGLYCWIEGHTDLVGGDDFNLELSVKRAKAVKDYLVKSMRMDASKIITRGFGRYEPLVTLGDAQQQAANRRVEIRMRKTPPTSDQMKIAPQKAAVIEKAPPPAPLAEQAPMPKATPVPEPALPKKAILVKPRRALPVEEEPAPMRAAPVEEEELELAPAVPKASVVEPPRAVQRALQVEE